ncbi:MAG: single-stranded DNA-binding protein [Hungatella hathewayi]|nr:single-stranded DNA-binding protein [Hungatella hathewayi]MBS4984608.1 single-stranded DNA-binding protein [Hungatella hathewayi]MBS5062391.1 single-stranded DNA-binding protein [Hungatella hathewayi]
MNRVILMGRLTRDPEVRYSQGERSMAIARYTLAVDRRGRRSQDGGSDQQTADFINIVAFDRAGEFAEKYFRQGMRVLVSGRIQTGSYTNKDGQKVYTTDVIVDDQEFADSKGAAGEGGGGSYQPASRPAPTSAIGDGFMNIPDGVEDEGLPFN